MCISNNLNKNYNFWIWLWYWAYKCYKSGNDGHLNIKYVDFIKIIKFNCQNNIILEYKIFEYRMNLNLITLTVNNRKSKRHSLMIFLTKLHNFKIILRAIYKLIE